MTESGPPMKNKRLAARFFKNPPQPHMCIQDYLKGSIEPCYVNVLSWDKITTANCPFDQLRLYGGMKITPPRTEKPMTTVFFVIANPEILRTNGKTASDPKEQRMLIELLLDFIEAMNKGIIFKRQYKILQDIFIIGELKLIWELVQNDRAKMQNELQQQLDDNNRKPVPQYPHYQNYQLHQDFQQKQQQQQQQQQQHHHQQQQHQQNNNESLVKPPQYQANNNRWQQHYQDNHANQEFNPSYYHSLLSIASNNHRDWLSKDQIPSSSSSSSSVVGCGGGAGGSGLVDKNQQPILQQQQQQQQQQPNPCMYQYQQLSGQIFSYNVSKVHAKQNPNPQMSLPVVNNCGQVQYMSYNHFHPENNVYVKVHRMQQPQQPQIQLAHAPPPPPPQANSMSIENFYKDQSKMIAPNYHHNLQHHQQQQQQQQQRSQLPEMSCNGSVGSLPSSSSSSSSQSNSPIRLLQRNASLENPTLYNNAKKIQVTDLDEDEPKDNPTTSCNKIDTNHNATNTTGYYEIIKLPQTENSNSNHIDNQQVNNDINNQGKMRILKRSKSLSDDKNGNRDIKIMKNCGDKSSSDNDDDTDADDNKVKLNYDTEQDDDNKCQNEFVNQTEINKNGCAIKNNNTIDNFDNKQLIGTSADVANCIVNNNSFIKKPDNNNDDNDDKLTNAIAQMSIKDCPTTDAGEFHGVIS